MPFPPEKIQILIHRESILHSAVEYCDNSVIAQLGAPDMRLPIQYAPLLAGPGGRSGGGTGPVCRRPAHFRQARPGHLPLSGSGHPRRPRGGTAPAILNGANEVAVARFLAGEIGFLDIPRWWPTL